MPTSGASSRPMISQAQELMKRIKEDVHSPAKFRVNGVVPNMPQFYEAFTAEPGDKMYLPENERAIIW
jgi:predicted metalloendopeptidase